jgi:hypothetical protein
MPNDNVVDFQPRNRNSNRDPFEAYRERCIYAILSDRLLTGSEVRVGVAIAMHLNRETRDAWPSEDTLADLTGQNRRHLKRDLEGNLLRHIEIEPGSRGRGKSTRYRFQRKRTTGGAFYRKRTL